MAMGLSQRESVSRFPFSISFIGRVKPVCTFSFLATSSPDQLCHKDHIDGISSHVTSPAQTSNSPLIIPVAPHLSCKKTSHRCDNSYLNKKKGVIIEIPLKVPPKSLLKFMCISKPWHRLISSHKLVKTHVKLTANDKECSHHTVIFQDSTGNFKVSRLPPLFDKEQRTELFDMDSPIENPTVYTRIVGSVNGLICLYSKIEEPVLWNPTIRKCKKLPAFGANLRRGCSYSLKYGFGYDESHDNYKVVVIQCISDDGGSYDTVVTITV